MLRLAVWNEYLWYVASVQRLNPVSQVLILGVDFSSLLYVRASGMWLIFHQTHSYEAVRGTRRIRTQVGFLPAQRPPCGQEQQAGPRTVAPRTGCQQMRLLTKPAGSWLWHVSWNTALPWRPASLTFPWPAWHPFIASAPASVSLMTATQ